MISRQPKFKIIIPVILAVFVLQIITSVLFYPKPAQAFGAADIFAPLNYALSVSQDITDWIEKTFKHAGAVAYKNMMRTFLSKIAYKAAVDLASGGKGQDPLIQHKDWGSYLRDAADDAAGEFVSTLGKENFGMNLCEPPNLGLKLKLILGIGDVELEEVKCSFSEMRKNWDEELNDPAFLKKFSLAWSPEQNDLGVTLNLASRLVEYKVMKKKLLTAEREEGQGFKGITSNVSNYIKTPASMIGEYSKLPLKEGMSAEKIYTGDPLADALGVFTNTLANKLLDKWIKKGMINLEDLARKDREGGSFGSGKSVFGEESARAVYSSLGVANITAGGDYDVVTKYSSCPSDPKYAQVDNCVIDPRLSGILNGSELKTIQKAINDGDLHGEWMVGEGNLKDGPTDYLSRYSLTNIKKLRKARIVPLGLEIAASKINSRQVEGNYSLSDIVNAFYDIDSPFYHLVDPDWVLKAPSTQCRSQVYGSIPSSGSNYRDEICVDEQHCVSENADGSCNAWGYCAREKNIWNFSGDACPSYYNSCQTYKRKKDNKVFSYLTNTLDKDGCDKDNAGCQWYSYSKIVESEDWNKANKIYFTGNAEQCSGKDVGCKEFLKLTDAKEGASLTEVYNTVQAGADENYSDYATVNKLYLKYNDNLKCEAKDAGCELYTPVSRKGEPPIPGIVKDRDACDSVCVGYRYYKEMPTIFDTGRDPVALISKNGKKCSAQETGCEEFTNLDVVAKGGEGKEYYTYIRQCQKPDNACANFFTWVGSEQSGYQLESFSLKALAGIPATTDNSGACCDPNLPSNDPESCVQKIISNPDCKEFYNEAGEIFYRSYTKTITCSNNCHPLRKTESAPAVCAATGGQWQDEGCIYMAIPSQGITCSSNAAGCREYKGNTGSNYRLLFDDDFEDLTNQNWEGGTNSKESVNKDGHSLIVNVFTEKPVLLTKDKSYILSFWLKGGGGVEAKISRPGDDIIFGVINSSIEDWNFYTLGPIEFNQEPTTDDKITISGQGYFFLDNIVLKEIIDSVYLVKNSWSIPSMCDEPIEQAQINCEEYKDSKGKKSFIKSFSHLCPEDKVGCELLIDTQGSDSPYAQIFNQGDPLGDETIVPADQIVYAINNSKNYCNIKDKGCQAFGLPELNTAGEVDGWQEVYLKNDPNKYIINESNYTPILCSSEFQGCEEFTANNAPAYFIDPKEKVCEYREKVLIEGNLITGWFIKGTNDSCYGDYTIKKVSEIADYEGWGGLCASRNSGCAEYKPFDEGEELFTGDSYYYLDNEKIEFCQEESWKDGCVNFYNTGQEKDQLLSVVKDRACGEWLQCMSERSVWDKDSNRYKSICTQLGRCQALKGDGKSSECDQWVIETNPIRLNEINYAARDVSWQGKDYSGYSLYNFYPLNTLKPRDYSVTDEPKWRLTYIDSNGIDQGLTGPCATDSDCSVNFVCESNVCVADNSCRGYPESDSPFPTDTEYKNVNKFESGEGGDSLCFYEKVGYTSAATKYYNYQSDNIAQRVCIGGAQEGKKCDDDAQCGEDGLCDAYKKTKDTFLGWEGYCVEPDISKKDDLGACLTWWPTDMFSGSSDIYNQFVNAGFNPGSMGLGEGPYYCMAKEWIDYEWRSQYHHGDKCVSGCESIGVKCNFGYKVQGCSGRTLCAGGGGTLKEWDCVPIGGDGCYTAGTLTITAYADTECFSRNVCKIAAKVAVGTDNKAWTDRVWKDQRDPKWNTPTYNYDSACGVFGNLPVAGALDKEIIFPVNDAEPNQKRCRNQSKWYVADKSYDATPLELRSIFAKSNSFYQWNGSWSEVAYSAWDITGTGIAPKIFATLYNSNTNTYSQGSEGRFTINGENSGNIVGRKGVLAVILQFYASSTENQMPIIYRGVNWGIIGDLVDGSPGLYKNNQLVCEKSCKNNPAIKCKKNSECGSGNTCAPINFGNTSQACSESYVQYSRVYTCTGESLNMKVNTCPIDANGPQPGNGSCCVFNPRVIIKDNWGWCNGGDYAGEGSCPVPAGQPFNGQVIVIP